MVKLEYYRFGAYQRKIRLTDKVFNDAIKRESLVFSHENENEKCFKDKGCGTYWLKK